MYGYSSVRNVIVAWRKERERERHMGMRGERRGVVALWRVRARAESTVLHGQRQRRVEAWLVDGPRRRVVVAVVLFVGELHIAVTHGRLTRRD